MGVPVTLGSYAAKDWVRALGLDTSTRRRWFVEVALDVIDRPARQIYSGVTDTRFHLHVYPEEWAYFFSHGSRASWIRVTDQPFVHGADDYQLLAATPRLADLGGFIRMLEERYRIQFRRDHALVHSNLENADAAVRRWLETL